VSQSNGLATSEFGPTRTFRGVRLRGAIGGIADIKRTRSEQFAHVRATDEMIEATLLDDE